jgi:nitrous oxidase accessory protein
VTRALARGAALVALLAAACAGAGPKETSAPAAPARPAACTDVPAGADLQALLDAAEPGAALCLAAGEYAAPLSITRRVTVWGPRAAVVRSGGHGTSVRLEADGAALLGITIDGSGHRFDLLDAALHVRARDARVEGVLVQNASHGILVEQSERALVRGNHVRGDPSRPLGLRGDGIRLWETRDSRVEENRVEDSRDLVVWYSGGNRLARNRVTRGRYGTHLMYSHGNRIEANVYTANVTGIFLMYSRDLTVAGNVIAGSAGAAGIGLGLKEAGNLRVAGNLFVHNTTGVYVDTSPLWLSDRNVFEANVFRLGDVGVLFHASEHRNSFERNSFQDNASAVRVEGRGDALGVEWRGNYFDEYAGFDLDGDGIGDFPFELASLASSLEGGAPSLAFFAGTPALAAIEAVGRIVPLFRPHPILVDPEPRVAPLPWEGARAG